MSSFFDQELWRLFGDGKIIDSPACAGRTCFGTLGKDLRVRIQFVSTHISGTRRGRSPSPATPTSAVG